MIWKIQPTDQRRTEKLSEALDISPPLAQILINRGFSRPESARRFLEPRPSDMYDPNLLADMDKAVERLNQAFLRKEKIFVFGDYDVDGVTSIAALSTLLDAAGASFEAHQPNRLKEGYGLSEQGVQLARKAGAGLLIALDCGTEAHQAVEKALASGLDVIVIDHHKQRGPLPPALAVLNPNRTDCPYPFKELAAVGVVFKLLQAGEGFWKVALPWERIWQLAALGTVADVAPLVDENRILVKIGLDFMRQNRDPAFRSLVQVAGLNPQKLGTGHLSFQLAPRLNAAGRMGTPEVGRKFLRTQDLGEIEHLASHLNLLNQRRRAIQSEIFKEVEEKIQKQPEKYLGNVIMVEGQGWNKGIVGIVAAKIQEKYYRPTVVIALKEEEGVGSARSIPGFELFEAISRCSHVLDKFGGHKYAAGISIKRKRIDEFRQLLGKIAGEMLSEEDLIPKLRIDAALSFREATFDLLHEFKKCEPYGLGNPQPVFLSSGLTLRGVPRVMGKKGNHLKMWLQEKGGTQVHECVGWNMAHRIEELNNQPLDAVYQLKVNSWRNQSRIQLVLKDFRPTRDSRF